HAQANTSILTLSLHDALPISQAEYVFVKDDLTEYVLRIGLRGRLKEAQILYLNTKKNLVTRKDFMILRKKLQKEMKIDLLSFPRSEEHTSELQSRENLVCRLL